MITIDYNLKRDETDRVVTFTPKESLKTIPNLSLIEGPNSSGKSTLMHLIALAFGGQNNPGLSDSLKGKLNALSNTEYQELSYEIIIEDGKDRLQLLRNEATEYRCHSYWIENGSERKRPLSEEALNRRYFLLYDIPEDPIGRLKKLTDTIKHNQNDLKNKMQVLIGNLNNTLRDIDNSQNPEKIKEIEKDIKDYTSIVSDSNQAQEELREKFEVLSKYVNLKNHQKALKKLKDSERDLISLEKKRPSPGTIISSKREKSIFRRARAFVESIEISSEEIFEYFEVYKNLRPSNYYEWQNYNFTEMLDTCSVSETIIEIVNESYMKTQEQIDSQRVSDTDREKSILIEKVLELLLELKEYEIQDLNDEATESFHSFIKLMKEEQKRLHVPNDIEIIENIRDLCKQVLTDLTIFKKEIVAQLIEEKIACPNENSITIDEYENLHKNLLSQIDKETHNLEELHDICIKNQVDPDDVYSKEKVFTALEIFDDYKEIRVASAKQWQNMLNILQNELSLIGTTLKNQEELLSRRIIQKDELQKKKVHPYYLKQKRIEGISQKCGDIARKLEFYGQYLEKIKLKDSSGMETLDYKKYVKSIGKYLAEAIGEIHHIDGRYSLECVDLIDDIFETQNGKTIRFSDMGTGQGQSTYLLSQLKNAEISGKKVVALFDEIALMDNNSLAPIKMKMSQMNKDGKLLAGIMVQRNDEGISVEEIGE